VGVAQALEADYLIVGAGAVAMAFADTLLSQSDAPPRSWSIAGTARPRALRRAAGGAGRGKGDRAGLTVPVPRGQTALARRYAALWGRAVTFDLEPYSSRRTIPFDGIRL